jgi:hypothetical protein
MIIVNYARKQISSWYDIRGYKFEERITRLKKKTSLILYFFLSRCDYSSIESECYIFSPSSREPTRFNFFYPHVFFCDALLSILLKHID